MKTNATHYAHLFLSNFVNNLLAGIVFGIGAFFIVKGQISTGSLVSFIFYAPGAYAALRVVFQGQIGLVDARVAAEKLDNLLALDPESRNGRELILSPGKGMAVEFRDVTFTYGRGDFCVKNLSFHIKPGQFVGIVGMTGGGKTTILDLLAGFYLPQSGAILIDGEDMRELYRSQGEHQPGAAGHLFVEHQHPGKSSLSRERNFPGDDDRICPEGSNP